MFKRLRKNFALRGWKGLHYGILDINAGKTAFLNAVTFQALSFCDGRMDLDSPLVLPVHREAIGKMSSAGIVEDCPFGSELESWQKYRLSEGRYAALAHWSITGRCNLRCRHCYMSAPQAKYGELTTAECLRIIDQIEEAGIGQVSLTGGEPLVRKDFWQLVDALRERRIIISQIYTNGLLVTDALLEGLKSRGIACSFSLSFDGCDCHDWMRGVSGAERAVVEAIRKIRAHDFEAGIETALYSDNLPKMGQTYELLASLGVRHWKISPAMGVGNWQQEQGRYDIPFDELYATYLDLIRLHRKSGRPIGIMLSGFYYQGHGSKNHSIPLLKFDGTQKAMRQVVCRSCRVNLHIMADGKLLPCIPMTGSLVEKEMPSLIDTTISRALAGSRFFDRIDTKVEDVFEHNPKCAACEHRLRCGGGCRAISMAGSGDFFSEDAYSCFFFENGYEQKIHDLVAAADAALPV